ncbi:MAG: radical SAM protein [Candidatus Omnitrophota bacterium]
MKYLYGPLHSRRLGLSLGITLTPYKICSFDCIYCQLGKTTKLTTKQKEYVKIKDILAELKQYLKTAKKIPNYISFSGYGEPTLNLKFGRLIQEIKKITDIPICVITNSSLFGDRIIRKALLGANLVVPSLDAIDEKIFKEIDKPVFGIKIKDIINGLIKFRQEFKGEIWLEVMILKDLNDSLDYARQLKKVIEEIQPDRIQLNSPIRKPKDSIAKLVSLSRLKKIKKILGKNCEII